MRRIIIYRLFLSEQKHIGDLWCLRTTINKNNKHNISDNIAWADREVAPYLEIRNVTFEEDASSTV